MTDVLAIAEHRRGTLRDVSYELITAGRELAEETDGELHLAVIGGHLEEFTRLLSKEGVDVIHAVSNGEEFNHDVYTQIAEGLVEEIDPGVVLVPNSVNGLDYGPALANRLGRPLVSDVTDASFDGEALSTTREMYGSKVETTVEVDAERTVVMIRGGEWPSADDSGDPEIRERDASIDESAVRSTVRAFEEVGGGDVDIADAEVLVSVGRGIDEEENLELVEELADALDATLSASRPIVDSGWLEKNRQVGQSGKTVTPKIYIAIGISGAVQHVAGMKGSETIIAINTDPNAPIFDIADYGIVEDLFDVVPALIEEFER
ncbi:electron transfer flavoprotein subunit alpha/FixB family protein [Halalkalicoccus ordinarius]|uniref:electron transfer flavoprotein subunit alpha/FixB family protein n=1 Tax=Halalkalicoccus ordinarius TaxID=3116651 RepID=UPI00300F1365